MELRCPNKLFGRIIEPAAGGIVEIKCGSQFCGSRSGVVVLHQFSAETGELLDTKKFKDTPRVERTSNALGQFAAVRSA